MRLAARIVDTPCNEMNTDNFLEVNGPRSCAGGWDQDGMNVHRPQAESGESGAGGELCLQSLNLARGSLRLCERSLAVHPAPRGQQPPAKGSGGWSLPSRPLGRAAAMLQGVAEAGG